MKNKHHDVLVAWAEGRPIQFRPTGRGSWVTVETEQLEHLTLSPYNPYYQVLEWRVKPDLPWYRVGFLKRGNLTFTSTVDTEEQEQTMESGTSFVRWLTERISYEV